MKLGGDFWFVVKLIYVIIKALVEWSGDDEDKAELKKNGG